MYPQSLSCSLAVSLFICHTVLQRDLADMQLLVRAKMETMQKVFGQGLLMANIYHFDVTVAKRCWSVGCVCANVRIHMHLFHICQISL